MLTTDLLNKTMRVLSPLHRQLIEGAYIHGERETELMRQSGMKRSEVRATVAAGLEQMRLVLRCRGVRSVSDVF
jgi:hypothetical protein